MRVFKRLVESPVGHLLLSASMVGLCELHICSRSEVGMHKRILSLQADPLMAYRVHLDESEEWLSAYFGQVVSASNEGSPIELPLFPKLDLQGTEFQVSVWQYLANTGVGETLHYGDIAHAIDKPRAARAVGSAMASNPIPIIVPCHRVLPKGGGLGHYSGEGGVKTKKWLLDYESKGTFSDFQWDFQR